MPEPFVIPEMTHFPAFQRHLGVRHSSVRCRSSSSRVRRPGNGLDQILEQSRHRIHHKTAVQIHTDNAGGRRQDLRYRHLQKLRDRSARSESDFFTVARSTVRVPCIHQNGADTPA